MPAPLRLLAAIALASSLSACSSSASPSTDASGSPPPPPASTPVAPTPDVTGTPGPYTFDDEFDGTSLGAVWQQHFDVPGVVNTWSMAQATVANGLLSITASDQGGQWVSALLDTKETWTQQYGRFEARIQVPEGQGLWPAFWSYRSGPGGAAELDPMEICSSPLGTNGGNDAGLLHQTIHWRGDGQQAQNTRTGDLGGGFHVYAVDWRADHVTFYLDGRQTWTFADPANIPAAPLPLILDLAVGGSYCGPPDASTPATATMLVDWVHVLP